MFSSVVVTGPVEFGSLDTVRAPFKCRNCSFPRGLDASDVVFDRIVDLSGSDFGGTANFEGATFQGPALFTSAVLPAQFHRAARFRLALFDDLAAFDDATTDGLADFSLARFRAESSFSCTTFLKRAAFGGAALGNPTIFSGAQFLQHADFVRSSLGAADFRNAHFLSMPQFDDATFRGSATFGQTHFDLGVSFSETQFSRGAIFPGTKFRGRGVNLAADFTKAGADGDLDFSFARFEMAPPKRVTAATKDSVSADFDRLVSRAEVALSGASFASGHAVSMDSIKVHDLRMSIGQTARLSTERERVLKIIEAGAKERGDLAAANKADFELHVLASRRYKGWHHAFDVLVYRDIAGYLVRPLRPLVVLVAVAAFASLLRVLFVRSLRPPPRRRYLPRLVTRMSRRRYLPRPVAWVPRYVGRFLNEFFDALSRTVPRRGRDESPRLAARFEVVAYRLLLACVVIGLANSNPTLRQLVDALK